MSNQFWSAEEIQKFIDEISTLKFEFIGDRRLESQGYIVLKKPPDIYNIPDIPDNKVLGSVPLPPYPKLSFGVERETKLHLLVEKAIDILNDSLDRVSSDERKVQIALDLLMIAFTSGAIDL